MRRIRTRRRLDAGREWWFRYYDQVRWDLRGTVENGDRRAADVCKHVDDDAGGCSGQTGHGNLIVDLLQLGLGCALVRRACREAS
jgi:hypothetical protein